MPLDIISRTVEFYEGGLSTLSERLRKNWLQKLDAVDTPDDSLTNLTWLYVSEFCNYVIHGQDMHPVGLELDNTQKSSEFNTSTSVFLYNVSARKDATLKSSAGTQPFAGSLCDPQVRMDYRTKWTGKPPFSYATLICLAMRELGKPKVTLSDIYGWIMNNFAYYRHTDSSWQNSVRHNLSLNKCFEKVPRDKNERGKGGFWRVNPKHADWLEANLAKCKRVAPPPGPAPPVPRSMLLQQRQQMQGQFVQQNFLPGTAQQANLIGSVGQSDAYGTPDFWSVGGHKSISPLSGSSSSLSSSPLSMSSAPSPANSAVYRQQPPVVSHHLVSPADLSQIRPCPTSQERDPTYATPCISLFQQDTVGPNQGSQSTHTHRRKSPLYRHTVLSEHEQLDPMCDELPFEVRTQNVLGTPEDQNILGGIQNSTASPPDGKRRNHTPLPRYISPATDRKTWEAKFRRLHCPETNLQSAATDVSRKQRSSSSLPSIESYGGREGHESFIGYLDNPQSKADKRLRLMRHQIKVKQFPTRTLPPRRRQSRWAITRDSGNETPDRMKEEKLTSALSVTHPKRPPYSNGYNNGAHTHFKASGSPSYLIPLVDEDDVGCSWPPITKPGKTVRVSDVRNPQSDSPSSLPRLLPRASTRVTPPYVPAGLSPRSRGLNKRECSSSAASSSSVGSSLSGTSITAHSDGHLYHSIPPQGHSTPKRVETQTCKQSSFNNCRGDSADNSVHFSRLYPTSGEAEAHLGTSPDGLRMPKWASVFLSDGDEAELQPALWTQTESGQDTVDIFAHLETSNSDKVIPGMSDSGNSTLHQPSPNESCFSYMSGLTDVLHPLESGDSQYSNSEEQKNLESTLNSSPVTSSPILDAFNLDSSDLDFQTLNGLVEASGPIPLDLDFSLTASLNTPYSSASYESVGLSSALFSPQPWSSSGAAGSSETITSSWIGDSTLFSSSNCFLSILDGPEGFFSKTTVLPEDGENAPSDRLSTPPSR
ncbi:hypothetical protein T265_06415 [Opisthorchis viverrini]|uniref:Fork-head domain-containing protein n=1 Tax=Opisthorchis viverrini TaxID=6198 RepID=A0A074ZKK2_OPIVI|nr:hypothetical protein T265_06415 [Opisthorchis viverrini]KER26297.1 hypothetical protein T265_06415 [Opisthorchis viverrini]